MNRKSPTAAVFVLVAAGIVATHARQDAKPDVKKWDVADPIGPTTTLAFDTSEGTWMNVDVSPDGTQVVFDLLGDIYLVPIAGSAAPARRLTSGPTFDMQPRFSPDGKRIAMSSDRDGLWNIWTVDLEGKNVTQISREKRWFVNSPTWSPDGTYVYARRHFVKERSLGAGEIWLYHSAGPSDGLQVTEFPVRMLRDVRVSPDGRLVVFSALGHLYARALPSGEPRRLTPAATDGRDTYEFFPAFSRDGQWIVYTTWNDADLGRVRVVKPDGSGGRDVVARPGHYVEASFSPDGKSIVYRHAGGDAIRGPYHSEDAGVYVVPTAGGTPLLARDSGSDPEFDHTGTRIYIREVRNEKYTLLSVGVPTTAVPLPGRDEIEHVRSDNATQIVPSPDGKWVAFEERFRTYVAAFPHTGRPVDVGPATQTYPVQRVSRDAGFYLHWSGDSRSLHWALGPELFTRQLAASFAFVDGGQDKPGEPEAKGVPIGFTVKGDMPSGSVALVGARVITMAGIAAGPIQGTPGVIENATVIVEGNRITSIGPSSSVTVPAGATRVDVKGKTIMPGIVDVHGHLGGESSGLIGQSNWPLAANLAFGVTTSHDPSNDSETVFTNAELVRAGAKLGPRVFSTGTILYGAETPIKAVVESYEDALSHVRRQKALGAISVKSYNQQRRDARQMIVKASRELEVLDVPEGGSLLYMNQTHILDGHTGVEHSLPVPRLYKDTIELFAKSTVGYTPTLIVGYGGLSGEYYWYQNTNVWENERLLRFTPREVIDPRSRRRLMAPDNDFNHVLISRGAKQVSDAGGSVQLGAHGQLQGLGAHWELWMLQQGGMTPMESLRAATIAGARYLGLDGDIGSLEKGKLADLIVLDRNPLENIRNSESIGMVMMNGRLYDGKTLAEIGATKRPAPRFWWE